MASSEHVRLSGAQAGFGAALVQVTSSAHVPERARKIMDTEDIRLNAIVWLNAGGRILLQGWSKKGPRGKRKVWTLMQREIVCEEGQLEILER